MKIYQVSDSESAAAKWFETKAEALKAFSKSGEGGHHMQLYVYEFGTKKSDLINLLNNVAYNTDDTIDGIDLAEEHLYERVTHSCTYIKEKNGL
ncbi:MAG TPA: hypothetical protein DCS60_06015 [Opitutae bacterium]|nr:hypothetical protein [Opitutae bacterium]